MQWLREQEQNFSEPTIPENFSHQRKNFAEFLYLYSRDSNCRSCYKSQYKISDELLNPSANHETKIELTSLQNRKLLH